MDDDLVSEQRLKYETLAARISVGKASQDEAAKAIIQLCKDNERLAVIAGKLRAAPPLPVTALPGEVDWKARAQAADISELTRLYEEYVRFAEDNMDKYNPDAVVRAYRLFVDELIYQWVEGNLVAAAKEPRHG